MAKTAHNGGGHGGIPGWFKGAAGGDSRVMSASTLESNRRMLRRQKQHHHSVEDEWLKVGNDPERDENDYFWRCQSIMRCHSRRLRFQMAVNGCVSGRRVLVDCFDLHLLNAELLAHLMVSTEDRGKVLLTASVEGENSVPTMAASRCTGNMWRRWRLQSSRPAAAGTCSSMATASWRSGGARSLKPSEKP